MAKIKKVKLEKKYKKGLEPTFVGSLTVIKTERKHRHAPQVFVLVQEEETLDDVS